MTFSGWYTLLLEAIAAYLRDWGDVTRFGGSHNCMRRRYICCWSWIRARAKANSNTRCFIDVDEGYTSELTFSFPNHQSSKSLRGNEAKVQASIRDSQPRGVPVVHCQATAES